MEKQKSILLAEDDECIRHLFYEFMKISFPEYEIETFEDGTSLQGRLEKNIENVKVVITDNQMPGITGSEIIKDYAKKVPMVLVYGGKEYIGEEAIKNGAVGYLLKPINPFSKLTEIVQGIVD